MSKVLENAGIPTALITTLVPIASFSGSFRIIPGCGIDHPLGNPDQPPYREKQIRRKIVFKALEALETEVAGPTIFHWDEGF